MLPNNTEVEAKLLNIIASDFETIDEVLAYISEPEYFYKPIHQEVFKSILNLKTKGQSFDMAMIAEELNIRGVLQEIGGVYELSQIFTDYIERFNLKSFCEVVKQKYVLRELIKVCHKTASLALAEQNDGTSLISDISSHIEKISLKNVSNEGERINTVTYRELEKIEQERKSKKGLTGLTSGIKSIDNYLDGFQAGGLYILGARPSIGKTAMALNFAYHASVEKTVLMISYEMTNGKLARRLMSIDTRVPFSEISSPSNRLGEYNYNKLTKIDNLPNRNIILDDSCMNLNQLTALATRLKKKDNLGMIIIDYLQLMPPPDKSQNREQEISKLSRGLKMLAMKLEIPIIALSQLSRNVVKDGNRAPNLSDLRESGSLEQDANAVLFLYGATEDEMKANEELRMMAYLSIAKNRDGEITSRPIELVRDMAIQSFFDEYSIPFEETTQAPQTIENNPFKGIRNNYDIDDSSLILDKAPF